MSFSPDDDAREAADVIAIVEAALARARVTRGRTREAALLSAARAAGALSHVLALQYERERDRSRPLEVAR